jgi:hypothetical protein
MTRRSNASIAGVTFLAYITLGITNMVLFGRATGGEGVGARLASIAQHQSDARIAILLDLLCCFCALVLAVTLYAITREQDSDLAMLGLTCRVGEGLIAAAGIPRTLALIWLATATGAGAPDAAGASALGAYLLHGGPALSATFFAVGSTLFAYLLLRGRMIPVLLAWVGVLASVLLVVCLPLQLAGLLGGPILTFMWLPMLAFEVPLALWLLIRGVAVPARTGVA